MKTLCKREKSRLAAKTIEMDPGNEAQIEATIPLLAVGRRRLVSLLFSLTLFALAPLIAASAQQVAGITTVISTDLPDAPQPQPSSQNATSTSQTGEPGSISGVVLDPSGARVVGALVTLNTATGVQVRTMRSRDDGIYVFTAVPPGLYTVMIVADGLESFTSAPIALAAGQVFEVPRKLLAIASANTSITVRPTEVIAAEQIKAEEKQRLLGVMPDFYVSYVRDAAPMTTQQKYSLAAHDTFDWTSYAVISVVAGVEQANNNFSGYGKGAAGYGKRWAAQFGDGLSEDFLSHAVFASMFHQDPRYFYQGTGTTKSRLYHAVSSAFVARSDSGKTMPNYSYLLGAMGSGALSNAYYPHADRGIGLVFTNAAIGIGGRAAQAVLQEFVSKKLTKNAPKSSSSSP